MVTRKLSSSRLPALATLAILASSSGSAWAAPITVLPAGSTVAGKTIGAWSGDWWRWAVSFSQPNDPFTDATGSRANLNQSGPVFFLAGSKLDNPRRAAALDVARQVIDSHPLSQTAGATSPDGQVVVVRVLAPLVEPAMDLMKQVWAAWRAHFWKMPAHKPRIWAM